jgi:hypothetical protein
MISAVHTVSDGWAMLDPARVIPAPPAPGADGSPCSARRRPVLSRSTLYGIDQATCPSSPYATIVGVPEAGVLMTITYR